MFNVILLSVLIVGWVTTYLVQQRTITKLQDKVIKSHEQLIYDSIRFYYQQNNCNCITKEKQDENKV